MELVKQLLISSSYYILNKPLVRTVGLREAAILSLLCEVENKLANTDGFPDGWFYCKTEVIMQNLNLSRREFDSAIANLKNSKLLDKKIVGMPAVTHYKLNYPNISDLILQFAQNEQTSLYDMCKQVCTERANKFVQREQTLISNTYSKRTNTEITNTEINSPQSPQGVCERNSQEDIFEAFRQIYKGSKRGLQTEFANFKKKHKDWREVLPNLKTLYEQQLAIKEDARNRGCFVPQEKNLSTYLNQRCWEEELNFENNERKYISEAERARRSYQELSNEICDFITNADLQ